MHQSGNTHPRSQLGPLSQIGIHVALEPASNSRGDKGRTCLSFAASGQPLSGRSSPPSLNPRLAPTTRYFINVYDDCENATVSLGERTGRTASLSAPHWIRRVAALSPDPNHRVLVVGHQSCSSDAKWQHGNHSACVCKARSDAIAFLTASIEDSSVRLSAIVELQQRFFQARDIETAIKPNLG